MSDDSYPNEAPAIATFSAMALLAFALATTGERASFSRPSHSETANPFSIEDRAQPDSLTRLKTSAGDLAHPVAFHTLRRTGVEDRGAPVFLPGLYKTDADDRGPKARRLTL